jgi:hypothetical protein
VIVRRRGALGIVVALVLVVPVFGAEEGEASVAVHVDVDPVEATVGDRLRMQLEVDLPPATRFVPPQVGPALGPFAVVEGSWSGPEAVEGGERWTWTGVLVTFRPGEVQLPAVRIVVEDEAGRQHATRSEPVGITVLSVLEEDDPGGAAEEISDLKPPASLPPDYGPLVAAVGILALLLLGAAVFWWLHRRYAARLAAVPAPDDPFHRTPPTEWVYAELQKLLERRLAERGQVTAFFAELAAILKRYLGGRYRIELMERTTAEVPDRLRQVGTPPGAIEAVRELLARCDMVKFAKEVPPSEACRSAIEAAYRIVDATKPRAAATERGAA